MKTRKISYHRLMIVILSIVLAVAILGMSVFKVCGFVYGELNHTSKVPTEPQSQVKSTKTEKKYTVVIDAGHGGYDSGSESAQGLLEKDITLTTALALGEQLEKEKDIEVLYTRKDDNVYWTNDNAQDLMARVNVATKAEADLFIALHLNDSEVGSDVKGYDVWVSQTSQANINFANNINEALSNLNYTTSRGVRDEAESNLMVLHYNTQPAVLIELGFISNAEDLSYLTSEKGKKSIVKTLAKAMLKTLQENSK